MVVKGQYVEYLKPKALITAYKDGNFSSLLDNVLIWYISRERYNLLSRLVKTEWIVGLRKFRLYKVQCNVEVEDAAIDQMDRSPIELRIRKCYAFSFLRPMHDWRVCARVVKYALQIARTPQRHVLLHFPQ